MNTLTFTAPSGHTYTIREQNGQDEEVLTKVSDVKNIMNITKFIQGLILSSSRKPDSRGLTVDEVLALPVLDRYAIIFQARIFSIGEILEFTYDWHREDGSVDKLEFEQDLNDFLLPYDRILNKDIEEEEFKALLDQKPDAIPMYPVPGQEKGIELTLESGKRIKFDLLDGNAERYAVRLSDEQNTRNAEFLARNLRLEVEGNWDKVQNFSLFSRKDMMEMRRYIRAVDPTFQATTDLTHPTTGETIKYPILGNPAFFFPEDVE